MLFMEDGLIDVHAHYLPSAYRRALTKAGIDRPDGFPFVPEWDAGEAVAVMDQLGIAQALMSISSPGLQLGARVDPVALAREVNEEGAAAASAHPGRLRLLASLPLPDVDASLAEMAYAFDHLAADGVVLMTNYRGTYLGDPALDPVMDELDRRGAIVALHPTSPPAAEAVSLGRPRPMLEFPFDTTRAVVNLILNGTLARRRRIRMIVPHAGSALAALADRVQGFTRAFASQEGDVDVRAALRGLWFDTAGDPLPTALPTLIGLVGEDRVLYGSDLPFAPVAVASRTATALGDYREIMKNNAVALLGGGPSDRDAHGG